MSDAPSTVYRPLWLTDEEHQRIFGELLLSPEGLKEERLAELLTKADARSNDGQGGRSLALSARAGAFRIFGVALVAMLTLTLLGIILAMVGHR
jgi:hypothetical protein